MSDTVSGILERADAGWKGFVDAARALPEESLLERRVGRWTRLEMLVHISAWHRETARRLRIFLDTGEPADPPDSNDAFNARVALESGGLTVPEVLDALDRSYDELRGEIAGISDEQLDAADGWAGRVFASNTYRHYADHRAELD